jgi:hypothetical protein
VKTPNSTKIFLATLLVALLVVDFFSELHRNELYRWFALFIYVVALAVSGFFENRWISRQADQLKAHYRVVNFSMWVFLLLAISSTTPNLFIAGQIDKTVFWPVSLLSFILLAMSFVRRRELLRELAERDKSASN